MTDRQQIDAGKTVKFGLGGFGKPTPQAAKYILRAITYLGLIWAFVSPQITEIPAEKVAAINKWWLITVGIVSITIKFFGWDYKSD